MERAIDKLTDAVRNLAKTKASKSAEKSTPERGFVNLANAPARITVNLPASAKLYVDDNLCPLTSSKRSFATPKLQRGQKYFYNLRVEMTDNGQAVNQSRRVVLEAGQHVQVTFNPAAGVFTVQR